MDKDTHSDVCDYIDGSGNNKPVHQRQSLSASEEALARAAAALDDAFERLTKALNEFASAFIASEAFEDLCTQIIAAYFGYKQPQPRPPKSIDPTVDAPVRRIIPRARSQLRCTKRR